MTKPTTLTFRLFSRSFPLLHEEAGMVEVGLQDKDQQVHVGALQSDGVWRYEGTAVVKIDKTTGEPDFAGPFVHGVRGGRFLYISWKRIGEQVPAVPTAWVQRVKIPLTGLGWATLADKAMVEADISGRKPHASELIAWKAVG